MVHVYLVMKLLALSGCGTEISVRLHRLHCMECIRSAHTDTARDILGLAELTRIPAPPHIASTRGDCRHHVPNEAVSDVPQAHLSKRRLDICDMPNSSSCPLGQWHSEHGHYQCVS